MDMEREIIEILHSAIDVSEIVEAGMSCEDIKELLQYLHFTDISEVNVSELISLPDSEDKLSAS